MRQIDRDVDPEYVAEQTNRRAKWVAELGHPKRCETNIVHPGLNCCLYCGADMGESCRSK